MRLLVRPGHVAIDLADPALRLTPEQQAACVVGDEIALTAGAGAGKTHTLSVRYVALLLAQAVAGSSDITSVLVLTFTERAAAEMAERCQQRVQELLQATREATVALDAADPGSAARIVGALDRMASEADRARISTFHAFCVSILRTFPLATHTAPGTTVLAAGEARRVAGDAVDAALDALVRDRPTDLGPLLDAFGSRSALVEAARTALERSVVLRPALLAHARGEVSLEALMAAARPTAEEAARWTAEVGLPTLQALIRLTAPSGGGVVIDEIKQVAAGAAPTDPLAVWSRYRSVLEVLLTDAGVFRALDHARLLGTRATWPDARRYDLAKQAARALADLRRADWTARAEVAARLPTLADPVLLEALRPFARLALDAGERLDAALDRSRTTTFDVLQARAIDAVTGDATVRAALRERHRYVMVDELQDTDAAQWSLVRALGRADPDVPEDRLFVVGDPKQAIYTFRGGDVRVFRRAVAELGVTPRALTANFRSARAIVDWCNVLFPHVLGGGEAWDVPYTPMVAAVAGSGDVQLLRGTDLTPDRQADVVASWLATALEEPTWSDREVHPTPPFAVLLRARTHQGRLEAALRRRGVPYVVARGLGFWARREVVDLVITLSAITRHDPMSVVGFLRSPLGGATDQDLTDWRGRWEEAPSDSRVGVGMSRVAGWRTLARERPPSRVVEALVGALRPFLAVGDPSGQAEANADRLVAEVAALEPLPLAEIAERLQAEVDAGSRDPEAVLSPGDARVLVCTVHAAKGLEFPVVVVPHLDARTDRDRGGLRVARLGDDDDDWALAMRVPDPEADVQTRTRPGRLAALEHVLRSEADAEERRLLYVAVTRARERLVLVGADQPPGEPGARKTWMQLVTAHLPPGTTVREVGEVEPPSPKPVVRHGGPPPPEAAAWFAPVPVRTELVLAASSLDRYAACPARWVLGDHLGLPENPTGVRERSVALAAARGRVVHEVLEHGLVDDDSTVAARWRLAATRAGATAEEAAAGRTRVLDQVAWARASDDVRRVLDAPGLVELPFRVTHDGVVLQGRIDRLWRDGDQHVVVDWKTEARRSTAAHALQMQGYAWGAESTLGSPVRRGLLVFTAVGETVVLGPYADASVVPALLEEVATTVTRPWSEIERDATRGDVPRPCATCGFRGRGCRGVPDGDVHRESGAR